MPGVTSHRMDFHHNYGGINGHGGGYGIGQRNGYGGPDMDQNSMDRFENGRDPESTLELDHLATYSSKSVMKPEDGLRKLRGMESTTGIWTMRCIMIVEPKHLIVVDKGTLDELERFPLDLVYDPTAIFKEDRREVYTNLLLFSVLDKYNNRWDMHIFQSLKHPAQHIVDEILSAKEGRPIRGFSSIPPPPMGPAPDPPGYGRTRDNRASFMDSSGQNEALERDVQFLNCCFDDIEKFVARLQQAAEAYKELENRRKERHQHKKKNDRGPPQKDGMLGMRARPPPGDDFIDIFQKIKWAFNLLAKLKAHIHDPNAPELVHFIFTPLSLIYEASRDPYHQGVDLASKAVSPLLTRDAKELLLNCLTSKELELWQLLGRNWTTSEDEYPGHVEAFHPRFYNGWTPSPPAPAIQNKLPTPRENGYRDYGRSENNRPPVEQRYNENEGHYVRNIGNISRSYRQEDEVEPYRPVEPISMEPQRSFPNDRARSNANYKEELRRKNAKIYEAVHERTGRNQKEITVEKGDILEVLDDSRNWWRLKNFKGESGYAPYTILRDVIDDRNDMDRNGHHRGGSFGGYSGNINQSNHHIPVAPPPPRKDEEEFERVIKQSSPGRQDSDDSDRYRRDRRRDRPSNGRYSRDLTPDSSDPENFSGSFDGRSNNSREDIVERRGKSRDRYEKPRNYHDGRGRNSLEVKQGGGYHNQSFEDDSPMRRAKSPPPPPPSFVPPPPPESRPIADNKKNPMYGQVEKRADRDELHNELSRRLTGKPISIPKAKPVLLSTRSTQKEVAEWLQAKSFSQRCINALRGMNGQQLLRSKMKDLERLVGHDEAQRLDGHLTLLKNKTGYKTQGPKELQAILQQRKQMAETYGDEVGKPPSFAPDSPDYSDDNSEVQEITTDFDKMLSHY